MKPFIRTIAFTVIGLYILSRAFPAVSFANISVLFFAGVVLTLLSIFVRPFLKILFLPVNLVTLGLFSWVINIIVIYLATLIVPGFHIGEITVPSFTVGIFVFPVYHLSQFWSLLFVSFVLSLLSSVLGWFL